MVICFTGTRGPVELLVYYVYCMCMFFGAKTKRPKTKRPKEQNVPRHKVPGTKHPKGKKVPGTKRHRDKTSQGQNVPRNKTYQGTKRPTLITKFSKTNFVLENWPHMLGNGPQPSTQFVIRVFLFWGG